MLKHFIIQVNYKIPIEQIGETLHEHRAFLQGGFDKGWLWCQGQGFHGPVESSVARAPSLAELEQFFTQDPYQLKDFAEYHFTEFTPVKNQPFLEDWLE